MLAVQIVRSAFLHYGTENQQTAILDEPAYDCRP